MDKLELLEKRKREAAAKGRKIREFLSGLLDENSLIETDAFSFSEGDVYGNAPAYGEGVVTGYATIDGLPVCVAAQNAEICKGALGLRQAEKILKCQQKAEKTGSVMLSVIDTMGAKLGEGAEVLGGYAKLMAKANEMYGAVTQIAVIRGNCFGAMAYYAALHDFVFIVDGGLVATGSPNVIASASNGAGKNEKLFGAAAADQNGGFASVVVKDEAELKEALTRLLNLLAGEDELAENYALNTALEELNAGYDTAVVRGQLFDEGSFFEINAGFAKNIVCGIAKIGGLSVAALLCADDKAGILLDSAAARKASRFLRLAGRFSLPLVSMVNCAGVAASVETERTTLIGDIAALFSAVNDYEGARVAVVCGRAIGAGFIVLASKDAGFDACLAWADAVISPIGIAAGGLLAYEEQIKKAKDPISYRKTVEKRYADAEADPFNAAKFGAVDDIIAPAYTRPYVISLLLSLAE
jgi:acetyl-CoA carboxylase carboxyltransferase component